MDVSEAGSGFQPSHGQGRLGVRGSGRGQGEPLESLRDLEYERLPELNGDNLSGNSQQ